MAAQHEKKRGVEKGGVEKGGKNVTQGGNEDTKRSRKAPPSHHIHHLQTIEFAADAMRGHRSAHSFATGPVIADPFISPLGLTITPALSSK